MEKEALQRNAVVLMNDPSRKFDVSAQVGDWAMLMAMHTAYVESIKDSLDLALLSEPKPSGMDRLIQELTLEAGMRFGTELVSAMTEAQPLPTDGSPVTVSLKCGTFISLFLSLNEACTMAMEDPDAFQEAAGPRLGELFAAQDRFEAQVNTIVQKSTEAN